MKGEINNGRFVTEEMSVDLHDFDIIHSYEGRKIVLGIRPGAIHLAEDGFSLPLVVAEPLGNETMLHLRSGEETLVAKVRGIDPSTIRESVKIGFDRSKLCLFDDATEERIA